MKPKHKRKGASLAACLALALTAASCGGEGSRIDLEPQADPGAGMSESYGTVEVTAQRNAYNPLTGLYDLPADRVGMRPVAVSVNNIYDCWPQYGISQADYILEMETEGGITRLMCLFSDTREVERIGSVRSLRDQFMEMIYPLDPIIVHIGTSIYADKELAAHSFRTIDAEYIPGVLWFDRERYTQGYAEEHCKFSSGLLIEESLGRAKLKPESAAAQTAFRFVTQEEVYLPDGGAASAIRWRFSKNYRGDGDFRFDPDTQLYYKWQYGEKQLDAGNGEQLAFGNVFVLFGDIEIIEGNQAGVVRVDYQTGGEGYYFSRGGRVHVTWSKGDYSSPMVLRTDDGAELKVNPGKSYFAIVRNELSGSLEIS